MDMKYAILIEHEGTSYGAHVPDLPGCVAVGQTVEEVRRLIQVSLASHLDGMREDGTPIPEPSTLAEYVEA